MGARSPRFYGHCLQDFCWLRRRHADRHDRRRGRRTAVAGFDLWLGSSTDHGRRLRRRSSISSPRSVPAGFTWKRNGPPRSRSALAVWKRSRIHCRGDILRPPPPGHGNGVNDFIRLPSALLLIFIPMLVVISAPNRRHVAHRPPPEVLCRHDGHRPACGLSGRNDFGGIGQHHHDDAAFALQLLAPKVMVGTDIVHAVVLTGVTSLLAIPFRQRRSWSGRLFADRFDSRGADWFALELAGASTVACGEFFVRSCS